VAGKSIEVILAERVLMLVDRRHLRVMRLLPFAAVIQACRWHLLLKFRAPDIEPRAGVVAAG